MKLPDYLNNQFKTAFSETNHFPLPLEDKAFKKGEVITNYGQIERKLYFINSGFVQLTMLHNGEERIIEFFFEDSFVCAYTSLLRQEPSDIRVTALCKCQTEVIGYNDLQKAYNHSLVINQIGRVLTEQIYILKTQREKDFLTKTAQERYTDLVAQRPDILKFIPVNKIAKYLGILPESLSRIRRLSYY